MAWQEHQDTLSDWQDPLNNHQVFDFCIEFLEKNRAHLLTIYCKCSNRARGVYFFDCAPEGGSNSGKGLKKRVGLY